MPEVTKDNITLMARTHATFRFVVDINGQPAGAFTECTLPTLEWDIEEVKEGGVNNYVHQLPGRRKATRMTLKNGVGTGALVSWYVRLLQSGGMMQQLERRTVTVKMLDMRLNPVMSWHIEQACPIKWMGPSLKTDDNTVAIETLELACGQVSVELAVT